MGEEELGLQVELERFLLRPLRRLPPSVGVAERRVAHGRRRVRLVGDGGAALAAFHGRAGVSDAGRRDLLEGAVGLRGVGAADRLAAQRSAVDQVAYAGVAGSAGAAALQL